MNDEEIKELISNNIRAERNRSKLTQEEVSKYLGITNRTYMKYESNKTKISASDIVKLSILFKCSISSFYLNIYSTKCE